MLSASEASAFQLRHKADSSAEFILSVTEGLRMTFKEAHEGDGDRTTGFTNTRFNLPFPSVPSLEISDRAGSPIFRHSRMLLAGIQGNLGLDLD